MLKWFPLIILKTIYRKVLKFHMQIGHDMLVITMAHVAFVLLGQRARSRRP